MASAASNQALHTSSVHDALLQVNRFRKGYQHRNRVANWSQTSQFESTPHDLPERQRLPAVPCCCPSRYCRCSLPSPPCPLAYSIPSPRHPRRLLWRVRTRRSRNLVANSAARARTRRSLGAVLFLCQSDALRNDNWRDRYEGLQLVF